MKYDAFPHFIFKFDSAEKVINLKNNTLYYAYIIQNVIFESNNAVDGAIYENKMTILKNNLLDFESIVYLDRKKIHIKNVYIKQLPI